MVFIKASSLVTRLPKRADRAAEMTKQTKRRPKMSKIFDGWEFPERCKCCGRQDNHDKEFPVTYLDCETKLCEFCFEEEEE
jgi:hypothetical protein